MKLIDRQARRAGPVALFGAPDGLDLIFADQNLPAETEKFYHSALFAVTFDGDCSAILQNHDILSPSRTLPDKQTKKPQGKRQLAHR